MKRNIAHIMKRAAALVLAGCLAIPLTACQSSPAASADPSGGETQAAETLPAETDMWLKVKAEEFTSSDQLSHTWTYEYNDYGQVVKSTSISAPDVGPDDTSQEVAYTYTPDQILSESRSISTFVSGLDDSIKTTEQIVHYNEYGFKTAAEKNVTVDYPADSSKSDTQSAYEVTYFCDPKGNTRATAEKNLEDNTYTFRVSGSGSSSNEDAEKTYDGDLLIRMVTDTQAYDYEYDENGNMVKKTITYNYGRETEFQEYTLYTYEQRTCKTVPPIDYPSSEEMDVISTAPTFDPSGNFLYVYNYGYDNLGNQVGAYAGAADGTFYGDEYNEYNENGQVIRVWTEDMVADMTYNDQGQRIREDYRMDPDGELLIHSDCEYDESGNLTRMITHADHPDYSEAEGRTQNYEYDENGNLLFCRQFDASGVLLAYDAYTYTEDGKISEISTYDGESTLLYVTRPQYEAISILSKDA